MQPYVVTIASEKGGVGKTTLATNLAIYLKALREDLPVTLFSFDNHFSVDQMFRIGQTPEKGDIFDLLNGRPAGELIRTGEFGVQYIPSSLRLPELRDIMARPDRLATELGKAGLSGLVLIDTRPDLDEFTSNALYTADRVIVPVKDAPSLENSRRLYQFFEDQGISRKPLRILPCLIDSRIRYQDGPFTNPYQLLKAYAINRGYRCMEGFIAKSPKVESLNTNPEGKVYPILTHGRGTEVHLQLASLARQIILDADATDCYRLSELHAINQTTLKKRQTDHRDRLERLAGACLACGTSLPKAGIDGFYLETGTASKVGFLEAGCFTDLVFSSVYRSRKQEDGGDGMRTLFLESAQRSYFALARVSSGDLIFYRFDEEGRELSSKALPAAGHGVIFRAALPLQQFWNRLLPGPAGDDYALLRKGPKGQSEDLLSSRAYAEFCRVKQVAGMHIRQHL